MNTTPTTEKGISDKFDKAVGRAVQNSKHEILQICRETGYSLEQVIELSLKNGLEYTAKSVSPGRRFKVLNEEVCEDE